MSKRKREPPRYRPNTGLAQYQHLLNDTDKLYIRPGCILYLPYKDAIPFAVQTTPELEDSDYGQPVVVLNYTEGENAEVAFVGSLDFDTSFLKACS